MLHNGVSYCETKRLAFPMTRRVRPCISSYREEWVGPFPAKGREMRSRNGAEPNGFRLTKEIPDTTRGLLFYHYVGGSGYLNS